MRYYLKLFFVNSPNLAWALSRTFVSFPVLMLKIWWFLLTRKTLFRGREMVFNFYFNNKCFIVYLKSAIDIAVLVEIFVFKEYDWSLDYKIKSILDLGAHWGDSSIYYALKYPEATIYAVEPTLENYKRLEKNSAQFTNIVPVQVALGESFGMTKMYVSDSSLGNSFSKRSISDESVEVETHTLEDFCRKAGIEKFDLIKFDIEGAESVIFSDIKQKDKGKFFIGEVHYDLMNITSEQIKLFFNDWNFTEVFIKDNRSIVTAQNNQL